VDDKRLEAAAKDDADWLSHGRTYDEQRFSPLAQINDRTVALLGLAWFADIATERGMEASPLAIDGVLYNVQPWNVVTAYDGKTGRVLWAYDPQVPLKYGRMACCDIVSRGLAAWTKTETLPRRLTASPARRTASPGRDRSASARSAPNTAAPSAASAAATARPMPPPAPVTSAASPCRSCEILDSMV